MTDYQDKYKKEYAKEMKKNFSLVREQLRNKNDDLMYKIKKRSNEYGIPEKQIIVEIAKYDTAVIPFVISPARQNFYEKIAYSIIKNIEGISELEKLPNNNLFVCNGVIMNKDVLKKLKQYPSAKTIDFKWNYNEYSIYASHKYTKDSGGSQDSAYKDLQEFIKASRDTKLVKTIFVAIADGDYYFTEDGNAEAGTTKMKHLESLCTQKVIACRMETLKEKLDKVCKNL